MIKAVIFDLDGVIVDTAKYHFLAWRNLAKELGITFSKEDNEQLKGVSRVRSLEILLGLGNISLSAEDFDAYAEKKNREYVKLIENSGCYCCIYRFSNCGNQLCYNER